jgi:hypothetical protein
MDKIKYKTEGVMKKMEIFQVLRWRASDGFSSTVPEETFLHEMTGYIMQRLRETERKVLSLTNVPFSLQGSMSGDEAARVRRGELLDILSMIYKIIEESQEEILGDCLEFASDFMDVSKQKENTIKGVNGGMET